VAMPESWKGRVFVKFGHYNLGDWKIMAFEMQVDRYDCYIKYSGELHHVQKLP